MASGPTPLSTVAMQCTGLCGGFSRETEETNPDNSVPTHAEGKSWDESTSEGLRSRTDFL